ncbi:MAG: hypothetical protein V4723_05585 [Pseudomonadota bacterium]
MSEQLVLDNKSEQAKNMARILYVVHGLCWFFSAGTLSIIPLIINYIKRDDAQGTIVYSHHNWMIRAFWWYLVWCIVGGVLAVTIVGLVLAFPIWGVAWLWMGYRIIRGFIDLNTNKAMPE